MSLGSRNTELITRSKARDMAVAFGVVLALTTVGCLSPYDYKMTIDNVSENTWLVRTTVVQGSVVVWQFTPGVSGIVSWKGSISHEVELLTADCSVVGTFQQTSSGSYDVPGVAGISGTVSPVDPLGDAVGVRGPIALEACGGSLGG